jgi:hypothetical protein
MCIETHAPSKIKLFWNLNFVNHTQVHYLQCASIDVRTPRSQVVCARGRLNCRENSRGGHDMCVVPVPCQLSVYWKV